MNHSLVTADRGTHVKIVVLSLVFAIGIVVAGIGARLSDESATGATVVKAGAPTQVTGRDVMVR